MKQVIKDLLNSAINIYAKFNPLVWQYHYCRKTLNDKRKSLKFEKIDSSNRRKKKGLWGRKNNKWFDFYYTIGDKQRAYLYIPDNWFFRYFDSVLNDWPSCKALDDKSLYDLYFAGINKHHTIGIVVMAYG